MRLFLAAALQALECALMLARTERRSKASFGSQAFEALAKREEAARQKAAAAAAAKAAGK